MAIPILLQERANRVHVMCSAAVNRRGPPLMWPRNRAYSAQRPLPPEHTAPPGQDRSDLLPQRADESRVRHHLPPQHGVHHGRLFRVANISAWCGTIRALRGGRTVGSDQPQAVSRYQVVHRITGSRPSRQPARPRGCRSTARTPRCPTSRAGRTRTRRCP